MAWINMLWLACTSLTILTSIWKKGSTHRPKNTTHWTRTMQTFVSHLSSNWYYFYCDWNWELIDPNIQFSPVIRTTAQPLKSYWLRLQEAVLMSLNYSKPLTNSQIWSLDQEQSSMFSHFNKVIGGDDTQMSVRDTYVPLSCCSSVLHSSTVHFLDGSLWVQVK